MRKKTQKEYNEEMYKKRREEHLCLWCGKPLDRDGALCRSCCDKGKQQRMERRTYLRKIGVCPVCGKNKITEGFKTCNTCREKATRRAMSSPERIKYSSIYQKKVRDKRREQGLCTQCGKNVPEKGFVRCSECRKRRRRYERTYITKYLLSDRALWKSQGRCSRCGREDIHPGTYLCEKCYQDSAAALEKARSVALAKRMAIRAEREAKEQEEDRRLKEQFKPRTIWERRRNK